MTSGSPVVPRREIALGGAQFGLDYGITNSAGRITGSRTKSVMREAYSGGISLVDTAFAYGESEEELGRYFTAHPGETWRVVTKTKPLRTERVTAEDVDTVTKAFAASLASLERPQVDILLAHHAGDLFVPGGERLVAWLVEQKVLGRASRIGASIYTAEEAERLLQARVFDVVQLPASVADQRLLRDGAVDALACEGVEIHVRSLFLQGLLVAEPERVETLFPGKGGWVARFHAAAASSGLTPLEACLSFFASVPGFRVAVVGVGEVSQLTEVMSAWRRAKPLDWSDLAADDAEFVDPRHWRDP